MSRRIQRRKFANGLYFGLGIVWPVISALLAIIVGLGLIVGRVEKWPLQDSIYFAFISGLTIGYGDLSPKTLLTRILAIIIGACGILLTGLVASIAVKALDFVADDDEKKS